LKLIKFKENSPIQTKRVQYDRQRDRDRLPHLIVIYQPFEERSQGRPFQGLATVNGTGTDQES